MSGIFGGGGSAPAPAPIIMQPSQPKPPTGPQLMPGQIAEQDRRRRRRPVSEYAILDERLGDGANGANGGTGPSAGPAGPSGNDSTGGW